MYKLIILDCLKNNFLRWLEIVSWRVRPGLLIAHVHASTPGSRRCKFSDLVPFENFCKIYISIENISESWQWKFVKFGTVVENGQEFVFWSKEKIL